MKSIILVLALLAWIKLTIQEVVHIDLTKNWKFRLARNDTWWDAKVPSTVHMDLLENSLIKDPFYRA